MSELYYVIPDIHGRYDLLVKALDHIFKQQSFGKVIFLGDYIDRGPESNLVVELLMSAPPKGWEYVTLKGNHEDMCVDSGLTGNQYYDSDLVKQFGSEIPDYVLAWMQNLPLYHIVDKNIFVHADWDENLPPEQQNETRMLWTRRNSFENFNSEYYLTHGHTPRKDGPILSVNRINLDAGAVYYGTLLIGVYKYNHKGPQDIIRII